ncbi:hypothetical protein Pmani_019593 [Petrolisthes manimaculis]|uniref:Carboxylesterase type B domain-containing protein n=1 Tax=Petrolisthes manimaculis TaxID=1843537 RepID=A0AAE1PI70_9EUCA|nr:hypothetical protein Pmani_019593 [Petrolisthes manimaculis]
MILTRAEVPDGIALVNEATSRVIMPGHHNDMIESAGAGVCAADELMCVHVSIPNCSTSENIYILQLKDFVGLQQCCLRYLNFVPGKRSEEKTSEEYQSAQVQTTLGLIYGTQEFTDQPRPFFAFRGIPYARPPVGGLRWSTPQKTEQGSVFPENRYLDATRYQSPCPQYDYLSGRVVGEEDCLYLNVFTPIVPTHSPVKLPVLVYLEGVMYVEGTAANLGPHHLLRHDIVLVTANYRLGALGFLSTREKTLAGNYGALDQVAILNWVQQYVSQFAGDPTRVTLAGHSSAASLVHLHTLSPLSIGMMSGGGNCVWSVAESPEIATYTLAAQLSCPTTSTHTMLLCLRSKSASDIVKAQTKMLRYKYWPVWFRPVVDGGLRQPAFLPDHIDVLSVYPSLRPPRPVLVGGVPHEGILFALGTIVYSEGGKSAREVYNEAVRYTITSIWPNTSSSEAIADAVTSFYYTSKATESLDTLVEQMSETFTDLLFTSCIWDATADLASTSTSPVYTSLVSPGVAALNRASEGIGIRSPVIHAGISHGHDLNLIFTHPHKMKLSTPDHRMSTYLTSTLASFVHTGSPQSVQTSSSVPVWSPIQPGQPVSYYKLSLKPPLGISSTPYRNNEWNLWRQTLRYVDTATVMSYAFSVVTWVLVGLLVLVVVLVLVFVVMLRAARRDQYPGNSVLTFRSRMSRNPSATSSSFSDEVTRGMS